MPNGRWDETEHASIAAAVPLREPSSLDADTVYVSANASAA